MNCDIEIKRALEKLHACDILEGAQRISTTCLYPDGARVTLFAYRTHKNAEFVVTDDGDAYEVLRSYGIDTISKYTKTAHDTASKFDMNFNKELSNFYSDPVTSEMLPATIAYLANCVQKFVQQINDKMELENEKDIRERIDECLESYHLIPERNIVRDFEIIGDSGKTHNFSHAILREERTILVSPVSDHHASIAPAYMKFNDVYTQNPDYKREAVISNVSAWGSNNLNLIESVVDNVNYIEEKMKPFMKRYGYLQN